MKRFALTVLFIFPIIIAYHLVPIRLFYTDIHRKTREYLFFLRETPAMDTSILILNIGKMQPDKVKAAIDSLLADNPRMIGVNGCHFKKGFDKVVQTYFGKEEVVFADCGKRFAGLPTAAIVEEGNRVARFRSDNSEYFESVISGFKSRGNEEEVINFGIGEQGFYRTGLEDIHTSNHPALINDKIVLIGYLGDYLNEENYTNKRITPLNAEYSHNNTLPDMFDIEVSANIISMIRTERMVDEISLLQRVLILFILSATNVLIQSLLKTRWLLVNLILATVSFFVFNMLGSLMIVYFFDWGYYLNLDEFTWILILTTLFVVIMNARDNSNLSKVASEKTVA